MKFIHKRFIFIYGTFSVNFQITVSSATKKDNIIFKRRVKIAKNRY